MDEFQARRLVNTYADMILRISYQYLKQTYDAEDICQTVFLKYITNNMSFDSIEHEKASMRGTMAYPPPMVNSPILKKVLNAFK